MGVVPERDLLEEGYGGRIPAPLGLPKVEEVRYLAFEGGGGRGIAYVGAVKALEELGIVVGGNVGKGNVTGISGASAGAITALLLALGVGSGVLRSVAREGFDFFFDGPKPGFYRKVNGDYSRTAWTDAPPSRREGKELKDFLAGRQEALNFLSTAPMLTGSVLGPLVLGATMALYAAVELAKADMRRSENPIVRQLSSSLNGYAYNLIYDRGVFPGFAVSDYFHGVLNSWWAERGRTFQAGKEKRVTFAMLYDETRLDLIITGTNVTQRKSFYFSHKHTPHLAVADAVAISMNLPVLFKPILMSIGIPKGNTVGLKQSYSGFWIDGGLLNNLPVHAFDESHADSDDACRKLNPGVLALRLTEGSGYAGAVAPIPPEGAGILCQYLQDILGTLLTPSEEGQIRTPEEAQHTVDLYTGRLSTTSFSPPPGFEKVIEDARRRVLEHFGRN
jgi:NTE family protein